MVARRRKSPKKTTKRAGCLSVSILLFLLLVVPSYFIYHCNAPLESFFSNEPVVSPADSIYHARLDSLIGRQTHINKEQTSLYIYDLTADCPVYAFQDSLELPPASCMKLFTAAAAQHFLGEDYRFADSLFVNGTMEGTTLKGDLILKGDYDPLIHSLDTLVMGVKQQGIERIEGNVVFSLPTREPIDYHPSWTPGDIRKGALPVMLRGEDRIRKDFVYLLRRAGIRIGGKGVMGNVPTEATCIYSVGHTVGEILVPTLLYSSNIMAEMLFNRICEKSEGVEGIYDYLGESLKTMPYLNMEDGSGLSPQDSSTTQLLCSLLRMLWDEESWLMDALPLAGSEKQRGTLMGRMAKNECSGRIYAKTGTLNSTGTSSLAGYCKGLFGHWYAFAIINNDTPVAEGRMFQDAVCLELVREDPIQSTYN